MANIMKCDRCGEFMEKTYYEIDITAHDVNKTTLTNGETMAHNICANMSKAFNGKKTYCKKCIDEINKVINEKVC